MDKSIAHYYSEANQAVKELEKSKLHSKAEELYYYHIDRVRDFQHERLIHLLVTFFFAALLITSIVGLLWVSSIEVSSSLLLTYLFAGAGLLLFATVLFYVRHYYQLENGTQKLYAITERLRELLK